jgi:protein O-mannosyl-transferase
MLAYANALHGPFVLDDIPRILVNTAIVNFRSFGELWLNYPPRFIPMLTFLANYSLGGTETFSYHLVNVGLHIINGVLLFWLLWLLAELSANRPNRLLLLFAALIFCLHPVQAQTVNYIVQRITELNTTFYLLTLIFYLQSRSLLSLICATLALFSKQTAFSLPFAVLLLDWVFIPGKTFQQKLRRTIPWFATALAVLPVFWWAKAADLGDAQLQPSDFFNYWTTQLHLFWKYLQLVLWPIGLSFDHDQSLITELGWPALITVFCLLGCLPLAVFLKRRNQFAAFGLMFFVLALVGESLLPLPDVIFEHRLYIPMIGVAFLFAALPGDRPFAKTLAGIPILIVLAALTVQRNQIWQTELTLWEDAAKKAPFHSRPHFEVGMALTNKKRIEESVVYLEKAVALESRTFGKQRIAFFLAQNYSWIGQPEKGIEVLDAVPKNGVLARRCERLRLSLLEQHRKKIESP